MGNNQKMSTNTPQDTSADPYPSADGVDAIIADLESRGLKWSLDNTGCLIEARIWDWPHVIGRYRPNETEPIASMLLEAMLQVDWMRYPVKSPKGKAQP